jgi:hypothetical protein
MLSDAKKASVHGDYDRRWMSDDYFDLIVWYRPDEAIHGFQLCYGKPIWERALTWIDGHGFSHTEVDAGEDKPTGNRTPILLPDGSFPNAEVKREFARRSAKLPKQLRKLVTDKISQFAASQVRRGLMFSLAVLAALAVSTFLLCFFLEAGISRKR